VAEKALKAFLGWHDRAFARTHNLVALLNLCADVEPEFASLQAAAVEIPHRLAYVPVDQPQPA
jgi:HEPN domain-containing protein